MGAMVQGSQGARVLGAWVLAGNVVVMVAVAKLGEDGEDRERTPPQEKQKRSVRGQGCTGHASWGAMVQRPSPRGQWSTGPGSRNHRGKKKVPRPFLLVTEKPTPEKNKKT